MKVGTRTDIEVSPFLDVRFIGEMLKGEYENIYLAFTTLEDEATDCWQDEGDTFLIIYIPKEKVISQEIDYKAEIIKHLPLIEWLDYRELIDFVNERLQTDTIQK